MVKKKESKILLKLLVDRKKDQVVAAESGVDFMDILVSLLTLPMGTIIRLIKAEAGTVGCINNLYQSVENLDEEDLYIEHCKILLLNLINPYPKYCMKLKYNKETFLKDSVENTCCDEYVFLKGGISFLISDGLQVKVASPSSLVQMLSNVGLSDMNQIEEMHVEIGKNEVIHLLVSSLISKTPLSDVFLPKQKQKRARVDTITMSESGSSISENGTRNNTKKLELKLTLLQISEGKSEIYDLHDIRQFVRGAFVAKCQRFAKEPFLFYVMDNLQVRSLSSTSTICLLRELNVPLNDIEEQMISIGESEALNLLKASLTSSSSALTEGLNHKLKKQIDEDVQCNVKKLCRAR
ncbi:hypothetical protein MTR67_037605 [Solanum verrucosum]|uniref:Uncharacterized protein n=1 Tax=Solanum verrucosum TaxID=315347 RepID=A0AAF0UE74_SOLVR|nr:hypothetical protein MTR67_037605 [Solanum verrucosum]